MTFIAGAVIGGLIVAAILYAYFCPTNTALLDKIRKRDFELDYLETKLKTNAEKLDKLDEAIKDAPEDCSRGPWCHACAYEKWFFIHEGVHYYCGKNKSCPQLLMKKEAKTGEDVKE